MRRKKDDSLYNAHKDAKKREKAQIRERRREEREYRKEARKRKKGVMPQWLVNKILGMYGDR